MVEHFSRFSAQLPSPHRTESAAQRLAFTLLLQFSVLETQEPSWHLILKVSGQVFWVGQSSAFFRQSPEPHMKGLELGHLPAAGHFSVLAMQLPSEQSLGKREGHLILVGHSLLSSAQELSQHKI